MNVYVRELVARPEPGRRRVLRLRAPQRPRGARGGRRRARVPGGPRRRRSRRPGQGGPARGGPGLHRRRRAVAAGRAGRRHPRQLLAVGPGRPRAQARAGPAPGVDLPHPRPGEGRERRPRAGAPGRGRGIDHRLLGRDLCLQHHRGEPAGRPLRRARRPHRDRAARGRPRLLLARRPARGPRRPRARRRAGPAVRRPDPAAQAPRGGGRGPGAGIERQDATLVVVGGPSGTQGDAELARVRDRAEDLGVADRIRWVDPVPHHLLSTYYRAADVCLVPEPLGVLRPRGPRGRGLRHPRGGRRRGRAALHRRPRPHRLPGRGRRPRLLRRLRRRGPGFDPRLAEPRWAGPPPTGAARSPGRPRRPACAGSTPTWPPGPRCPAERQGGPGDVLSPDALDALEARIDAWFRRGGRRPTR